MPVSKAQKTLSCIALQIKKGKVPRSYSKQASEMADSMDEAKLAEWCSGKIEQE